MWVKFKHLFFHNWTNWKDADINIYRGKDFLNTVSGQVRYCIICNKRQMVER